MAVLGYFLKLKGSGTSFNAYLILILWTKFRCHTFFPSQDIKKNVLISSYLDK